MVICGRRVGAGYEVGKRGNIYYIQLKHLTVFYF